MSWTEEEEEEGDEDEKGNFLSTFKMTRVAKFSRSWIKKYSHFPFRFHNDEQEEKKRLELKLWFKASCLKESGSDCKWERKVELGTEVKEDGWIDWFEYWLGGDGEGKCEIPFNFYKYIMTVKRLGTARGD